MWKEVELPENLQEKIINRIKIKERQTARIRFAFFGVFVLASIVALIPTMRYLINDIGNSGFYQYLFLIFSDSGIVLASWKEFSLSLAESLPFSSATAFFSVIFVLLWSLKSTFKNVKVAFYQFNY